MRDIATIAITEKGVRMASFIAHEIGGELHLHEAIEPSFPAHARFGSLSTHVGRIFRRHRALIFVMSLGIVNRVIAPYLEDKRSDPAVVTHDEVGRFVISTLSGHEGGANGLVYFLSSITGAEPVVTTTTEANRLYTCGVGFRRLMPPARIVEAIQEACSRVGITSSQLRCLATAWIKKEDRSINQAAISLGLHVRYIPKWLIEVYYRGRGAPQRSKLVRSKIGVYGVAEPCAILSGRNAQLILPKRTLCGVTVAIAKERLLYDLNPGWNHRGRKDG